jgi:hypothetical protein
MNSKLMSYEELVEKLKGLEVLQSVHKKTYSNGKYGSSIRSNSQRRSHELKQEINLVLSAIHHAKYARKFYEYKRNHDKLVEDLNNLGFIE